MTDEYTQFERVERLMVELSEHTLDDTDGTVEVFVFSPELIGFMNHNEAYDPTEARDLLHDLHADLFDELAVPA
jgi:hypothetical protein